VRLRYRDMSLYHPRACREPLSRASQSRFARLESPAMLHENLPAAIEGLSSRIIAIRDSL